jgi:hypothetical protein
MANRLSELEQEVLGVKQRSQIRKNIAEAKSYYAGQFAYTATTQADWQSAGQPHQVQYAIDSKLWSNTIYPPGGATDADLRGILKRIFTTFAGGDIAASQANANNKLKYRPSSSSTLWNTWNKPLASALSHGGRVLIRIKRGVQEKDKHEFWNWLVQGKASFSEAPGVNPLAGLQSRDASTHGIQFGTQTGPKEISYTLGRASKVKNYGMNVPVGGNKGVGADGKPITADGSHGHLFLHYDVAPSNDTVWAAAILIGCETKAPTGFPGAGGESHLGTTHKWYQFGKKQAVSVTGGSKWSWTDEQTKQKMSIDDPSGVPGSEDCMYVDISTAQEFQDLQKNAALLNADSTEKMLKTPLWSLPQPQQAVQKPINPLQLQPPPPPLIIPNQQPIQAIAQQPINPPIIQQPIAQQPVAQQPSIQQQPVPQLAQPQVPVPQPNVQQPNVRLGPASAPLLVQQPNIHPPVPLLVQPQVPVPQPNVQQPNVQQPNVQQPNIQQPKLRPNTASARLWAKLPDWAKKLMMFSRFQPGELEFARAVGDGVEFYQKAIKEKPGSYTLFPARLPESRLTQANPHRDVYSDSQIMILVWNGFFLVDVTHLQKFPDLKSFEADMIKGGVKIQPGGYFDFRVYYQQYEKMYTPDF